MTQELTALTSADWNGRLRTPRSIFWTDWRRPLKSRSRSFSRNPLKAPLLPSRCHRVVRSHGRTALSHNIAHNPLDLPYGKVHARNGPLMTNGWEGPARKWSHISGSRAPDANGLALNDRFAPILLQKSVETDREP
jgi:hypothetical protein